MKYGDKTAVDHLSMQVDQGTITAVLGPNGAGKTTTLETCEGYRRPQSGTVRVLGLDPVRDRRALLPRIGVMLQSGGAWSGVRAKEMLDHVAALHAHPLDTSMLHDRLGLDDCGRTPFRRLSGGQQQRLGLALALVGRPELVFVDEPTAGMDPQVRRTTWELLEELRNDGVTVVLTTHHMDEAERLSDLVHIVDRGTVIASGTPQELTSADKQATLRMVLPSLDGEAHTELAAILGPDLEVAPLETGGVHVISPADSATLAQVARWYEHHALLPVSLTLGQRTLEDVFLELTGREIES